MPNLPLWTKPHLDKYYEHFKVHQTVPDGNCLFESVQIILQSVGIHRTIEQLRRIVSLPVLKGTDRITEESILYWLEIYQNAYKNKDLSLLEEFKHMRGLEESEKPLGDKDRGRLYENMMTCSYWGEQHSVRILEQNSKIRFIIFNGDFKGPQLSWNYDQNFQPKHYSFFYLNKSHYSPVSFYNRFIFKWNELPLVVQEYVSSSFTKPKT